MKTRILLLLLSLTFLNVNGQKFSCGLGASYDMFSGTYGNADAVSFLYNPRFQFQCPMTKAIFAVSAPITFGKIISSSRERSNSMLIDIPLNFQVGINQRGPSQDPYKNNGIFIGGGMSRLINTNASLPGMTFVNSYVGLKLSPMGRPIELKVNYGRDFNCKHMNNGENNGKSGFGNYNRLSFAISYVLYCNKMSCKK
jgi:hypothetical protein